MDMLLFLYQIYTPYREGGSDKFQTQHSFHFFLHICKEKTNWQISKVIFRGNMWRAELQNPVVHFCFLRRKWGSLLVHYVNGNYAVSKASPWVPNLADTSSRILKHCQCVANFHIKLLNVPIPKFPSLLSALEDKLPLSQTSPRIQPSVMSKVVTRKHFNRSKETRWLQTWNWITDRLQT